MAHDSNRLGNRPGIFALLCLLTTLLEAQVSGAEAAVLTVITQNPADRTPMPARLHLADAAGRPVKLSSPLPFWRDHFSSPGEATFRLTAGRYSVTAERGPEWSSETASLELTGAATNLSLDLHRIANLPAEGWWPGETHIHRPLADAELLMRAEDLHFGNFITWWNKRLVWSNSPPPAAGPVRFDGDRFFHALGGEDERDGGALLFLNLDQPLDITGGERHHPSSLTYAREVRSHAGNWIDLEKPFWWDVPMWIAHGIGDSIGIAQNHMHRGGVMDAEAWGKPRDRSRYPGAHGNGLWTQDIYYHLLNCGIRILPSAGSASGVLPNPVGYNRAYVHFDGPPTWEKWFAGLRAGRVFVSNGPLLRARANGQLPGYVFRTNAPSLDLQIDGRLDSRDPIAVVELVRNGRAEKISLPARVTIQESGWFLMRAIAVVTNTFRFASTGPFYVELGNAPAKPIRDSARFFVDWCDERLRSLGTNQNLNAVQREEVVQPWREARTFWQAKLEAGAP